MSSNKKIFHNDEIDFNEIAQRLKKKRLAALFFIVAFSIIGYTYGLLQTKVFQSTITVRQSSVADFSKYSQYLKKSIVDVSQSSSSTYFIERYDINHRYDNEFELNLLSLTNLKSFIEQNKKLDKFKSYLEINNIEISDYFENKLKAKKKSTYDRRGIYTLSFSEPLNGQEFLNDYIIYTKQVTENIFRKELIKNIENIIEINTQSLEIAKKLNIEDPVIGSTLSYNENNNLFYKGTKILSEQLTYLSQLLNETKDFSLSYNPVADKASNPNLISKSPYVFLFFGIILGMLLSFFYILLRD